MKLILGVLIAAVCFASPAFATIAVATTKCEGGTANTVTTAGFSTAGASLLVVAVNYNAGAPPTLSNNHSDTMTAKTAKGNVQSGSRIYYVSSPTSDAAYTVTAAATSALASICYAVLTGTLTSGVSDAENGNNGDVSLTSIQTGSVSPAVDNEIIIATMASANTDDPTIDSSFTIPAGSAGHIDVSGGNYYGSTLAYIIQTTKGAVNPTFSWTNSNIASTVIATFKAATATAPNSGLTLRGVR